MMKFLTISAFQLFSFSAFTAALKAEQSIDFSQAADHVGKELTVTGKVTSVRTIASGMTFVNFGTRGANAFTAVSKPGVIDGNALKNFDGKDVEVTGTIELYKESPQIVLASLESIRFSGVAPAKDPDEPKPKEEKPTSTAFEIRSLDVPMERKEVKLAGKSDSGFVPTVAKVVIALPKNFKPKESQRILVLLPNFITETEIAKPVAQYAQVAAPKGWVVLIAHHPTPDEFPTPGLYPAVIQTALRQLATEFPGAEKWPIYLAGNSVGATRATLSAAALLKEGTDVRGCFLYGLNREEFTKSIATFDVPKSKIKRLSFFVSQGEQDTFVTKDVSLKQAESLRKTGVKEVRYETHPTRSGLDTKALEQALTWFEEEK